MGGDWFTTGRPGGHIDLPRLRRSELCCGFFAILARDPEWTLDWWRPVATADGGYRVPDLPPELDTFYAAGVRSVGLSWSRPNRFAHGVPFPSRPRRTPVLA